MYFKALKLNIFLIRNLIFKPEKNRFYKLILFVVKCILLFCKSRKPHLIKKFNLSKIWVVVFG